jgi:hypothetical protein
MMKKLTLAMLLLASLYAPCFAGPAAEDAVTEVPFTFEMGHVVVRAMIKREVPVDVILATGSEHSVMDAGLLQKYKLPAYYAAEGVVTGRNDRTYSFSTVPDLRVGEVKDASLNMRFGPSMGEISRRVGREVFGMLGADFFKGRVVQFDFGKKVVRFLPQSPAEVPKEQQAAAAAAGRISLPMRSYDHKVALPVVENVTFEGKKIKTLLDTGTVTVVSLSSSAAKQIGLTSPPEKGAPLDDKVKSLRFGEYELNDVPVLLYAKGSNFDRDYKEFGAVAGAILLQNFVVTFDYRKQVVTLERL